LPRPKKGEEKEEGVKTTVFVTRWIWQAAKSHAAKKGMFLRDYLDQALSEKLERDGEIHREHSSPTIHREKEKLE